MRIPYRVKRCGERIGETLVEAGSQVHRLPAMFPRGGAPVLSVYPTVREESELADLYHKASFFLPQGSVARVRIPIGFDLSFSRATTGVPCPTYLEAREPDREDIEFISSGGDGLWKTLMASDLVLVWDWDALTDAGAVAGRSPKLLNVDRHTYSSDAWTWAGILSTIEETDSGKSVLSESVRAFRDFIEELPVYDKVYVFGTGPSLDQAFDHDFSDGYRIVCNTIVNNRKVLDHIDPHIIVAGDAVYHFANNPHACAFRRDLEEALKTRNMCFVMRDTFHSLFCHHHPDVADRALAAEAGVPGMHFNVKERLVYHQWPHGNILNCLMLPLASGLADDVVLLGIDGRAPGDQYFWANSPENTYDSLKPAMREAHPAFFSTMDYEAYAQAHSDNAEKIMQAGEALGKTYRCLNESYVPAFRSRGPTK